MNIAFLFNSDHEIYNGFYGYPILELILKQCILQNINRNMKVSVGDIVTFSVASQSKTPTYEYFYELNKKVYTPYKFDYLIQPKLENISKKATIYCLFIQNMPDESALSMNNALKNDDTYLGAMDIDLKNIFHTHFFKKSLILSYRIQGKNCSIFYSMSENEDPDSSVKEYFENYGYHVIHEDIGAVHTIFDEYYDLDEHLSRIQDFKEVFLQLPSMNIDILDDLIISLEELHPKLFNAFSALARTYNRIETDEDIAQCSLSGRRILEQIADYLYPPSHEKYKGRDVGNAQYKNRLWAYIETTVNNNSLDFSNIQRIGKDVDRLIVLFNSGLHSNLKKNDLDYLLEQLVFFIIEIITLSPTAARKPYLAYEENINDFMKKIHPLE